MKPMSIEGFIQALYGKVKHGAFGVTYFAADGKPHTKWFQPEQADEMAAFIRKCGKRHNTYIDVNTRKLALDNYHRGESKDIESVIGVYTDFDIKGPAHAETCLPETAEKLYGFMNQFSLPPSIIVFSGNGVHFYWLFSEPYVITSEDDRDYIIGILEGWERYICEKAYEQYGWKLDHVADLARMLRAPDTTNFKTTEKPVCHVVEGNDRRYSPVDFEPYVVRKASRQSKNAAGKETDEFALMGTGSAEELISKCSFLQYCQDNAANLSEPYWYAAITNLAQTADGHDVIHEISSPYPGYTYQETERKYRHATEEDKPVTCEHIRKTLCFNCGMDCGVKAPISLIRTDKRAADSEWEIPIPFDEFKLPPFPVDALPAPVADFATAVAEHTQTPVDMAGICGLAVISTAAQGQYVVEAKPGWIEPVNICCLNIMPPSERKSSVENEMTKPINRYETEYNSQHAAEFEMSQVRKRMLERQQKALEEQVSKGKAKLEDLEKVVQERTEFREKNPLKLYSDDITTEKLVSVMAENNGRAAILSTEGGIFDTLAGIYTKIVNIDSILKGYSGDSIRVDRIGRTSECILHPTLTMLLMAQPSVLSGLMQNKTFRGRGLTARILYSMPRSFVGNRRYRTEPIPAEVYRQYEACIRNILMEEYRSNPIHITLSEEADQMIEAFADEVEPKLRTEYADIADWAGKLIGNTLRIAGLLCRASAGRFEEFMNENEPIVINDVTMANAIRLARYFVEHAKAAYSLMGADDTAKQCKYVLAAVKDNDLMQFRRRDIMRFCRSFKKAEDLQPILDHLVDYGYIAPDGKDAWCGKGRPPAQTYLVNPKIYEDGGTP